MVRGPVYFQTHTETDTHENDAVLQKRPESYQNKSKTSYYQKKIRKKSTILKNQTINYQRQYDRLNH